MYGEQRARFRRRGLIRVDCNGHRLDARVLLPHFDSLGCQCKKSCEHVEWNQMLHPFMKLLGLRSAANRTVKRSDSNHTDQRIIDKSVDFRIELL